MSKKKEVKENIVSNSVDEGDLNSQSQKLSRRQKIVKYLLSKDNLMRILLTTETKKESKYLRPILRPIKRKIAETFSVDNKSFQSHDVNELFWVYLNEGTDITLLSKQKKYAPGFNVEFDGALKSKIMAAHHYIGLLDTIIRVVSPYTHDIKSLAKEARRLSLLDHPERQEAPFTAVDSAAQDFDMLKSNKQHFEKLMKKNDALACSIYDQKRFDQKCKDISDAFALDDDYEELMMFALRGFHYFQRKDAVYGAFDAEQLDYQLAFDLPDYPAESPYKISLKDFLGVFQQLNFEKRLFPL